MDPSVELIQSKIELVPQNELLDIMNIPTLEYSEEIRGDKNPYMNAYADAIMANYNNRNITQTELVENEISNGNGPVESAVLWLEVINSNLNQLMGLAGVNNYLLGMMGVGGGVGQSDEVIDVISQKIDDANKKTNTDTLVEFATAVGTGAAIGAGVGTFIPVVGNAAGALIGGGIGSLSYVMARISDEDIDRSPEAIEDYNSNVIDNYKTYNFIGSGTSSYLYHPPMLIPPFIGNKEVTSSTEILETNNSQNDVTQEEIDSFMKATSKLTYKYTYEEMVAIILKNRDVTIRPLDKTLTPLTEESKNNNSQSTYATESDDLKYKPKDCGSEKIEYTVNAPFEYYITVNEAPEIDWDKQMSIMGTKIENIVRSFFLAQGLHVE